MLYYRLEANFDALGNGFCPEPPIATEEDGTTLYDLGKRAKRRLMLTSPSRHNLMISSMVEWGSAQADLVALADCANWIIRQNLIADLKHRYSGHVAWRATVSEKIVPEETARLFDKRFNVFPMARAYSVG